MRLYPPVWVTARTVITPLPGRRLHHPRRSHRHGLPVRPSTATPASGPTPTASIPTDSPPTPGPARPRYAYFPFAGGSRQCIAEGLAWMEGTLALAVIARDWRLTPPPGTATALRINPAISLRPAPREFRFASTAADQVDRP